MKIAASGLMPAASRQVTVVFDALLRNAYCIGFPPNPSTIALSVPVHPQRAHRNRVDSR
ncbi:MAG: hypothetical protein OXD44_07495 [Gammaproteobacteria bacterium]|nr:hypothetical protein [Gammaproteobacteria bacterium]